jgi:hypothetical protein
VCVWGKILTPTHMFAMMRGLAANMCARDYGGHFLKAGS